MIIEKVPSPKVNIDGPLQLQISALDSNNYVGVIGIGRIKQGSIKPNEQVVVIDREGKTRKGKILQVMGYEGLDRVEVPIAEAGSIVCITGIDKLNIKRSEIPAVTHVDYSARVQTVTKETNDRYYDLISNFKKKTGCPIIVNTSFNVRGGPIVNTPTDAFNCFMGTDLDYLVIGNSILDKNLQDIKLKKDYKNQFTLD